MGKSPDHAGSEKMQFETGNGRSISRANNACERLSNKVGTCPDYVPTSHVTSMSIQLVVQRDLEKGKAGGNGHFIRPSLPTPHTT